MKTKSDKKGRPECMNGVRAYVKKYHMLQEKDHVIAGVSGGADSVCLLFMLVKLQKEMRFGLTVVHIHHGLRGESADADENYVRALCEKLDVELLAFMKMSEDMRKNRS